MKKSVKILWYLVLGGIVAFFLLILLINFGLFGHMPTLSDLENPSAALASELYSSDGTLMGKYYQLQDRTNCDFKDISPNVIHALIATEDRHFYEHSGIDPEGTLAIPFYLMLGKKRGSSTITQQTAKNLLNTRLHTSILILPFIKLKEWIVAIKLERNFTKDEILALYLNTVPFGDNVYGIKNAAKTFFNKNPDQLNIDESATLIGMLRGNTLYNPRRNPLASLDRRNTVIDKMQEAGFVSPGQAELAKSNPIQLQYNKLDQNDGIAPYFREYLRDTLKEWCAEHKKPDGTPYNLYQDGLRIYTTINARMQNYAEQVVSRQMDFLQSEFNQQAYIKDGKAWDGHKNVLIDAMKNSDRYQQMKADGKTKAEIEKFFRTRKVPMRVFAWNRMAGNEKNEMDTIMTPMDSIKYMSQELQTGFMVMDPESGEVKVWVGGDEFKYFKYDHVHESKRQVGSTIKPLLYCYAIMNGFSPSTLVPNEPVYFPKYGNWVSKNAEGDSGGMVTLTEGLARSLNHVAAYLIKIITPQNLVNFAHLCGITSDLKPYPALSLGTGEISLYEMLQAYTIFPDKGLLTKPLYITRIEDRNGNILQTFVPQKKEIINPTIAYTMVTMMRADVDSADGTGHRLRFRYHLPGPIAGKTGTTNDQKNGWFIGYTPQLLAGAWVGCDNDFLHFTTLARGQGASTALPIWGTFFQKVNADHTLGIDPYAQFTAPPSMTVEITNHSNSLPANPQSQDVGNGNANDYYQGTDNQTGSQKGNAQKKINQPVSNHTQAAPSVRPKAVMPPSGN
ncbi:MAG: penicillin-binding protein 1A [Chitinophagaceae bacterium]